MKYLITNRNKPSHNPGVRKQDPTRTYRSPTPGSGKTHNNSSKSAEEYASLAQAAMEQGDRVLAQTYYQYAEHALRTRSEPKENPPVSRPYGHSLVSQGKVFRLKDFEILLEKGLIRS